MKKLLFALLIVPCVCQAQMEIGAAGMYLPYYEHGIFKVGYNAKDIHFGVFAEVAERRVTKDGHLGLGAFLTFRHRSNKRFTAAPSVGFGWAGFAGQGLTLYGKVSGALRLAGGLYFTPEAGVQVINTFVDGNQSDIFVPFTLGFSYRFVKRAAKEE